MDAPQFSVVVSTYNRSEIVSRLVRSVLASDDPDFDLVVVDDGSTDGTVAHLEATFDDPRLRVIGLPENAGMSEARRVGVEAATGAWIVVIDSDWELEPFALTRMREAIADAPPEVKILCWRVRWDSGELSPASIPEGRVGYTEKLAWWESGQSGDAIRATRRDVYDATPYVARRRGAMDTLYELDVAKRETATFSDEVLAIQHDDAANSWLRSANPADLIPRLRREAPDMLWMAETSLARHDDALRRYAPSLHLVLLRTAAVQAFILGRRGTGLKYARQALKAAPLDPSLWAAILLGLAGPAATLRGIVIDRQLARRRRIAEARAAGA